jgi:hypothetical protein
VVANQQAASGSPPGSVGSGGGGSGSSPRHISGKLLHQSHGSPGSPGSAPGSGSNGSSVCTQMTSSPFSSTYDSTPSSQPTSWAWLDRSVVTHAVTVTTLNDSSTPMVFMVSPGQG